MSHPRKRAIEEGSESKLLRPAGRGWFTTMTATRVTKKAARWSPQRTPWLPDEPAWSVLTVTGPTSTSEAGSSFLRRKVVCKAGVPIGPTDVMHTIRHAYAQGMLGG